MKVVMTQAVCPEGMRLLDGLAEVYVAECTHRPSHHGSR